ncbi:hypothetical protein SCALM49S_10262 [Streptomyces californicus]
MLGHGFQPYPGYAEAADQLVTFQGPWTDYRWSQVAEWTADYPPERFAHFVHGVPRTHLEEAMRVARWQGAGTIFFTDRDDRDGQSDPFATLPEVLGRNRLADRTRYLGMRRGVAVLRGEQPYVADRKRPVRVNSTTCIVEVPVSLPPLVEPAAELTVDEVRKVLRHLIIPDVGMDGQKR